MGEETVKKLPELDEIESLIKEGSEEVSQRNLQKATTKYKAAYTIAKLSGKQDVILSCACNLGAALIAQGRNDAAIKYLKDAVESSKANMQLPVGTLHADIQFNLGLAYAIKEDNSTAVKHFGNAAELFKKAGELKGYADSCQQLGWQYGKLAKPLRAADSYKASYKGYLGSEYFFLAGKMAVRQAHYLADGGKSTQTVLDVISNVDRLLSQISSSHSDKLGKLLYDIGSLLHRLRSSEQASSRLQQALDAVRTSQDGNEPLEAKILLTLGEVATVGADYTDAVRINKEASVLYGKLDNKKARGQCFYQLAEAYRHLGDHNNAEKYYHVAYQTMEDAGPHGNHWQVLEGLADLNYQRRGLDTAISYYRRTLTQLSRSGAHASLQPPIVAKLAAALEAQRAGVVKAASYMNRVPVLIEPERDNQLENSLRLRAGSPLDHIPASPFYEPLTSSRLSLFAEKNQPSSLSTPGLKKQRKVKRHGHRRRGSTEPVTKGVDEYNSEIDMSLVNGGGKARRAKRLPREVRSAKHRRAKHITPGLQRMEIAKDGATPSQSKETSTQRDDSSSSEAASMRNRRGRSASQTAGNDVDESLSTSSSSSICSDEEEEEEEEASSDDDDDDDDEFTQVSSNDSSLSNNTGTKKRPVFDKATSSRLGNTYEQPFTQEEPLYASIKSTRKNGEEKLYESMNFNPTESDGLSCTMPSRPSPSPPPLPEPATGAGPSRQHAAKGSRWDTYPESSVMGKLTRGQREMELYQVAMLAKEKKASQSRSSMSSMTSQSRSSMSSMTSQAKVPKSSVCSVM